MSTFIILTVAMILVALAVVIMPIYKQQVKHASAQSRYLTSNATLIKQRLLELDDEVAQGVISERHRDQAIKELKLALADESDSTQSDKIVPTRISNLPIIVMAILLLSAMAVYLSINNIDKFKGLLSAQDRMTELTDKIVKGEGGDITLQDVQDFSLAIRTNLHKKPDDPQGWLLLAQLYASMQMFEQAYASYDKAIAIQPNNLDIRERYATSLMMPNQIDYLEKAEQQLRFILATEPNNNNAALMLSLTAVQLGDLNTAKQYFAQVENILPQDNPAYVQITTKIAELEGRQGLLPTGFNIEITAIEAIMTRLNAENQLMPSYLFVFARDAQGRRPLPVAVKKLNMMELPVVINLTDADAMVPNWSFRDVDNVELVVRLSFDENVEAAPGEMTGTQAMSVLQQQIQSATLLINEIVK